MSRKRWAQLIWLIVVPFTGGGMHQGKEAQYAYFFYLDKYIKVEASTQRTIAHGSLYEFEEIRSLLPASIKEGGPPTLVEYDPSTRRLYFLSVQPETYSDTRYKGRIIIVELPAFKLVGWIDLGWFVNQQINVLLTPDGKQLLISYDLSSSHENSFVFIQEVYDTRSFKLLETKQAVIPQEKWTPEAGREVYFSEKARFCEDGRAICDEISDFPQAFGGYEYVIAEERVRKRKKPDWPLEVKKLMAKDPVFQPIWSNALPARVLLLDIKYHEIVEQIQASQTGKKQATGREFQGRPFTTGHFVYYDAMAGVKLKEFTVKDLAGDNPKVLCVTPDGRTAYYVKMNDQRQWELFAIDLFHLGKVVKIELFDVIPVKCIFANW